MVDSYLYIVFMHIPAYAAGFLLPTERGAWQSRAIYPALWTVFFLFSGFLWLGMMCACCVVECIWGALSHAGQMCS
jgi:hypothetical protein